MLSLYRDDLEVQQVLNKSVKETTDLMMKSVKQVMDPVPLPGPQAPQPPQYTHANSPVTEDKGLHSSRRNWRQKAEKVALKMSVKINRDRKGNYYLHYDDYNY